MKRLFYLYTLLILAGCTDMSVNDIYKDKEVNEEFQAFIEDNGSRTYIDEQIRMRWTAEDRVTLFRKNTYNREYMFTGKTGSNAGGFRQVSTDDDFWFGYDVAANYAVYPHSADTELDETELYITYNMPTEQTYVENSFGLGANVMVAVADDSQLMFKNVGSYLRVRLYGENASVASITLTSKGGEAIAGKAKITPAMDGNPTCEMIGNGQSIRLVCPTPVTISSDANNPTDFWIVVPPVTFSKGFSVTVENSNGETQVFDVDKSVTFKRNAYNNLMRELAIKNMPIYHVATAGTLSDLIPDEEKTSITEMKVTGYLNGDDVCCLRKMLGGSNISGDNGVVGKLTTLDLSEATIVEGGEAYYPSCYTSNNVVGYYMFYECTNLQNISLPKNTTSIKGSAFQNCDSLTAMTIPNDVTFIGTKAFQDCDVLTYCAIGDGVTSMGSSVFSDCNALTSVVIGDGLTSIEDYTFSGCTALANVNIGDGVTSIENCAFQDCDALINIAIPNGVTSIGRRAFYDCDALIEVTISSGTIGEGAFSNCNALTNVVIGDGVTLIGTEAFNFCNALTEAVILSGKISVKAFGNCDALTSIVIGDGVTAIESDAFSGFCKLKSVYISDFSAWCKINFGNIYSNPLYSGANLFLNDNLVTELTIPDDVTEIKAYAFSGYKNIVKVNIPNHVTSIGKDAFYDCDALTNVTIGDGVSLIGEGAFRNCKILTNITIPEGITSIGNMAFYGCAALKEAAIGGGKIGTNAFYDCVTLTNVTIGDGVSCIGAGAFQGCRALTNIKIPESVTLIDYNAFYGCDALANVCIGSGVTSIYMKAFFACSIKECYCYATTPPSLYYTPGLDDIFGCGVEYGAALYVPAGGGAAYKSSKWASFFDNIIEMD